MKEKICAVNNLLKKRMKKNEIFFILVSIFILISIVSIISASDVLVWQGQYSNGATFNIGTYNFNFTVYDNLTNGNICYSNFSVLTTGNLGNWKTQQSSVNFACNNVSKNYYLNININGVDQIPRKKLILNQLFDIKLTLEKDILITEDNLTALVKFENFGSDFPLVRLNYQILDDNGNVIHSERDFIIVQTERVVKKTFTNLNLKKGNYHLVLTTLYNINITDDFRQDFIVKSLSFEEFVSYVFKKKLIDVGVISLFLMGLILYLVLLRRLQLKMGENKKKR